MQSREQKNPRIADIIRRGLGGCPQSSERKIRVVSEPEPESLVRVPAPAAGPAAPAPAASAPVEFRAGCQTNLLLVLLLPGGLFYASNLNLIVPFGVLSAVLVYFEAENIHAGYKFEGVSLLGEVATWRPIVRAAAVFIGSFFLFAIYLICRREIDTANN